MPAESSHAANSAAHIGHVIERVRRQARVSPEALAHKTGAGLGDIADVLAGRRFPSRRFIISCARACGADPQVLLMVWEDEQDRPRTPPR
ncbi:helix-turn-helix domain-containing protein [Streptomyces seoulensis]|uniref:helix-turn-helix domain-containing protein n=1 Tax=Streptomyces seoulensis TaxID=73044 RepID=UPI003C2F7E67